MLMDWSEEEKMNRNVFHSFIISMAFTIVTSVILVTLILFSRIVLKIDNVLLTLTIPTIVSLIIVPYVFTEISGIATVTFKRVNFKQILLMICLFSIFAVIYVGSKNINLPVNQKIIMVAHFLMIAFSEEFFYRLFIFDIISQNTRFAQTVIITSLIFAFVGHIGEPFLDNLIYRLPLGILFSVIRVWSKSVSVPTVIHAIYNLLIII